MSAAQTQEDVVAKRARKNRETSRRFVLAIPDDIRLYIRENYESSNCENEQSFARLLMARGLRASGVTPAMLKSRYADYVRELADKRATEERARIAEEKDVRDEDYL